MRYELKSIGVWSVIKISFFFNLIGGLIFGLIYGIMMSFMLAVMDQFPGLMGAGIDPDDLSAGLLIVGFPVMFSVLGAIFGTLMSMILTGLYNVLARVIGGLEFNFAAIEPAVPVQPQPYREEPVRPNQPTAMTPPPSPAYVPAPPPPVAPSSSPAAEPPAPERPPVESEPPVEPPVDQPESDTTRDDRPDDDRPIS